MKKYKKYKDSGVEWIGEIPEEWEVKRIKYIANIFGRIGFRGYTVEDIVDEGEGTITLSPSNIVNHKINLGKKTYLSFKKYEESPEIKIYNNDIIFVKTGSTVGKVAHVEKLQVYATLNPQLIVFKNLKIISKLLYYNLISTTIQQFIKIGILGSVIPTLTQSEIGNYILVTPTIEDQTQIVTYLDHKTSQLETLISKKEELIEILKASRTKIISETVTKGLDKDVEMKDSGIEWIGEIPKEWKVSKVKYKVDINKNTLHENTNGEYEIKYIDISSVNSIGEIINTEVMEFKDSPSRARRIIKSKDTIISTVRTYLKSITWIDEAPGNLICSTGFAVLSPSIELNYKYLGLSFRSSKYIDEIVKRSKGVSYPAITASDIGELQLILPPLHEQQAIATYLDHKTSQIDNLISKIQEQITLLKKAKQKLITEVVTGKINVTDL